MISNKQKFNFYIIILLSFFFKIAQAQFPILMYHAHPNLGYTDARFKEHTDFLKNNDYHSVSLSEFYEWYKNNKPMPIRPLVITFDDNYIMLYTNVFPIIKEKNFVITNFTITGMVGYENGLHYCDWNEIKTMESSGLVSHQSHTITHPYLANLSPSQQRTEIFNSKKAIEDNITNKKCDFIAYPYGNYNTTTINLCIEAGYLAGISTISGLNYHDTPPFEMRRLAVDWDNLEAFKERIGFNALPPAPPGKGWTIDNDDVNFYYDKYAWVLTTSGQNYYGKNYIYHSGGDGSYKVKWAAYLPISARYNIYVWWASDANRASNTPYEIHHLNGVITRRMNQKINGGKWNLLGTYYFSNDTPAKVILSNDADGFVIADGIWFEPLDKEANLWCLY